MYSVLIVSFLGQRRPVRGLLFKKKDPPHYLRFRGGYRRFGQLYRAGAVEYLGYGFTYDRLHPGQRRRDRLSDRQYGLAPSFYAIIDYRYFAGDIRGDQLSRARYADVFGSGRRPIEDRFDGAFIRIRTSVYRTGRIYFRFRTGLCVPDHKNAQYRAGNDHSLRQ